MGEFRQEIVQKNKPLRKGSSSRGKRGQSLGVYDTGTDCHAVTCRGEQHWPRYRLKFPVWADQLGMKRRYLQFER